MTGDWIQVRTATAEQVDAELALGTLIGDRNKYRRLVVRCDHVDKCALVEVFATPHGQILRARGRAYVPGTVEALAAAGEPKPGRASPWEAWPLDAESLTLAQVLNVSCKHGSGQASVAAIRSSAPDTPGLHLVRLRLSDVSTTV